MAGPKRRGAICRCVEDRGEQRDGGLEVPPQHRQLPTRPGEAVATRASGHGAQASRSLPRTVNEALSENVRPALPDLRLG